MKLTMTKPEKKELKEFYKSAFGRNLTYKNINDFLEDVVFKKLSCDLYSMVDDFMNEEDCRKENQKRKEFRDKWGSK